MAKLKAYPKGLDLIREAIGKEKNVANFPNSERAMWLEFMPSPPQVKEKAEVLYFVGCMASFSPQIQNIPSAMVELLERAGVDFTVLGEKEWCCGYPLLGAGMEKEVEELIQHNTEVIEATGAKKMVFSCPSCYKTFKERYDLDIELLHHTQLIAQLIEEGGIEPRQITRKVTYHDPCDLGRHSGIYEEPRKVVGSLGGEFVEMKKNREHATCCGGGGDLELIDPELTSDISRQVVEGAKEVGAQVIVTACQQCKRVIKKGAKEELEVADMVELLLADVDKKES